MNLRTGEIERMAFVQEYHMNDTCQILARTATPNAYGLPNEAFVAGLPVPCGYHTVASREINENGQLIVVDAELRIGRDVTVGGFDRVRITKRLGQELSSSETFRIIGDPKLGPSGLVLMLKRVEDE